MSRAPLFCPGCGAPSYVTGTKHKPGCEVAASFAKLTAGAARSKAEALLVRKGRKGLRAYLRRHPRVMFECEYHHFDCAPELGGPCGNEVGALLGECGDGEVSD